MDIGRYHCNNYLSKIRGEGVMNKKNSKDEN